jgi:subtilase family serine protease
VNIARSRKRRVAGCVAAGLVVLGLITVAQGAGAVRPVPAGGPRWVVQTRNACNAVTGRRVRCAAVEVLNPSAVAMNANVRFRDLARRRQPTTTTTRRTTTTTTRRTTSTTSTTTSTTIALTPVAGTCTTTHAGYTPCDLRSAYAIPPSAGQGQTVAIVDAYNDPNAESDLAVYRAAYGLPACTTANGCFRKVNQNGGAGAPTADAGWAEEISLDLDMVSAVCPTCHIRLVEASSNTLTNLLTGENQAAIGASAISNSWTAGEFSTESSYDSYFNHGIPITVSSGDSGYGATWPASSPYVTAVGGTSLVPANNARGWSETAWDGAGSGCSAYEAKPAAQTDTGCPNRTVADVSAVADPNTGVAAYDSYQSPGWVAFGGTSVAAPIVASVYALAGNGATIATPGYAYSHSGSLFDVTSGTNGTCAVDYLCTAMGGYDGPTGLGTPNGTGAF